MGETLLTKVRRSGTFKSKSWNSKTSVQSSSTISPKLASLVRGERRPQTTLARGSLQRFCFRVPHSQAFRDFHPWWCKEGRLTREFLHRDSIAVKPNRYLSTSNSISSHSWFMIHLHRLRVSESCQANVEKQTWQKEGTPSHRSSNLIHQWPWWIEVASMSSSWRQTWQPGTSSRLHCPNLKTRSSTRSWVENTSGSSSSLKLSRLPLHNKKKTSKPSSKSRPKNAMTTRKGSLRKSKKLQSKSRCKSRLITSDRIRWSLSRCNRKRFQSSKDYSMYQVKHLRSLLKINQIQKMENY